MATPLTESATRHQVFLERLKAGEKAKFQPFLVSLVADLQLQLVNAPTAKNAAFYRELRNISKALLGDYVDAVFDDFDKLSLAEAEFELKALNEGLPKGVTTVLPTVAKIKAAAFTNPLSVRGADGGKLLKPFLVGWADKEAETIANRVRLGFAQGKTTQQVITEVTGRKANNYADGLLDVTRRNADAIVRTATQHVSAQARQSVWEANDGIVSGVKWVSALDNRTSQQCRSLDGQEFPLDSGPRPPIHIRCRSTTVPVLKGKYAKLTEGGKRASKGADGGKPVKAGQSYYQWLKKQPAAFQDAAIGRKRGLLLRNGGLTAQRFSELQLDKRFMPLTLDEMRKLEPLAFDKAGI